MFRELVLKSRLFRSPKWANTRSVHLKNNNVCAACERTVGLEVHHIKPVHLHPDLELDENNLITLCERHHFSIGHLEYWKSFNENVLEDAIRWKDRLSRRPE